MNRFLTRRLRECGLEGIAPSHGNILLVLFAEGEVTMGRLAASVAKDPSTTTALVKKLQDRGYVEVRRGSDDRRANLVRLTPAGREVEPLFRQISRELMECQNRGVNAKDLAASRATMQRIRANFEEFEETNYGRREGR